MFAKSTFIFLRVPFWVKNKTNHQNSPSSCGILNPQLKTTSLKLPIIGCGKWFEYFYLFPHTTGDKKVSTTQVGGMLNIFIKVYNIYCRLKNRYSQFNYFSQYGDIRHRNKVPRLPDELFLAIFCLLVDVWLSSNDPYLHIKERS